MDGVDNNGVQSLGTILSVWAHPDDETYLCGGLMCRAVSNGQRVVCVTATKGEKGVQDESRWPADRLGEIRSAELKEALDVLGIHEHHWLGYIDGEMRHVDDAEGAAKIAAFITEINPDAIVTFAPDGITGHDDHKAISRWVSRAVADTGSHAKVFQAVDTQEAYDEYLREADEKINIYFNIDKPHLVPHAQCDMCFHLDDELLDRKIKALHAMPSQSEPLFRNFGDDWARRAFECESFVEADKQ